MRWQAITGPCVDYAPYQEVGNQFPEIPVSDFETAVQLIEPDGSRTKAAEAVFRTLAYKPSRRWVLWLYRSLPGMRFVSEGLYRLVASHRPFFSKVTRLLWGEDVTPPRYGISRKIFLSGLGLIYFAAFLSLWIQLPGLIGQEGILPASRFLGMARNYLGRWAYLEFPTLVWLNSSDSFLHFLALGGMVLAVLVFLRVLQAPVLFLLWMFYLSLHIVGQEFLSFQWDILLLEAGFLAIFMAPCNLPRLTGKHAVWPELFQKLLVWLLFRLMVASGASKLLSGDFTWRTLTALNFHYETQPLPTWIGWYFHQAPEWFQSLSVLGMFGAELVAPVLIFLPRRLRYLGAATMAVVQLLILLTGNYCFFNWLTLLLCILLIDDGAWALLSKGRLSGEAPHVESHAPRPLRYLTGAFAAVLFLVSSFRFTTVLGLPIPWPAPVVVVHEVLSPFRIVNHYGLFSVMTTKRLEIIVEGSKDGVVWSSYGFRYKPGDPLKRPGFVAPHQPRLDWQMWFAALSRHQEQRWFSSFCLRLLEGRPEVLRLLAHNPFPEGPPRFIRAAIYEYQFTNFEEKARTQQWWNSRRIGLYMPSITLRKI